MKILLIATNVLSIFDFETVSHYIVKAGLEFKIISPLLPKLRIPGGSSHGQQQHSL